MKRRLQQYSTLPTFAPGSQTTSRAWMVALIQAPSLRCSIIYCLASFTIRGTRVFVFMDLNMLWSSIFYNKISQRIKIASIAVNKYKEKS